jgi:hypothetical protein
MALLWALNKIVICASRPQSPSFTSEFSDRGAAEV